MELIDGIKTKGAGVEIPDTDRRHLPSFFKDMGFTVGVEIGVQRGSFTRCLAKPGIKIYGVDPWLAYPDYKDGQRHQDKVYESAKEYLSDLPNCELIRKTSMEAVKDFEDESIDFVYIDGNHGFKYVTEDIFEWSKKVRKGGIISGHDYAYKSHKKNNPYVIQVGYVIDAYTKALKIKDWWILGRKNIIEEGEKRDRYRSWMWIKK